MMEDIEPKVLLLAGALIIGLVFGAMARFSGFCLRSAVIETVEGRAGKQVAGWLTALVVAIVGTQLLGYLNIVDLSESIYLGATLNWLPLIFGGFLFGLGMVITRGCGGRHLVLAASGNMRSWLVITVLGFSAYATIRGILAIPRISLEGLGSFEIASGSQSLSALLGLSAELDSAVIGLGIAAVALVAGALVLGRMIRREGVTGGIIAGLIIGLLIPAGWYVTGSLGYDDFEPARVESLTFTAPLGDGLQYLMTYTGAEAGFGVVAVAGTLIGAFLMALARGTLKPEGFQGAGHMGRYALGALFMGFGGVLALGCTIGAGLSGVSTLSVGSMLALASIIGGGVVGHQLKTRLVGGRSPKLATA